MPPSRHTRLWRFGLHASRQAQVVFFAADGLLLVVDTLGAIASAKLGFPYSSLSPISLFGYAAAGFTAGRIGGRRAAAAVGSLVAFIEATIGWFISWRIGPGRPPAEYGGLGEILLAVALVTAIGSGVGWLGGAVARMRHGQAESPAGLPHTGVIPTEEVGTYNDEAFGSFFARFRAIGFDCAVVVAMLMAIIIGGDLFRIAGAGRLGVAAMILYEPLQTWRYGGTLGHRWANLRVAAERTGANPGLPTAVLRFVAKVVLGLPSFIFMAVTRRHQALHDLLARTTVRIRNVDRAGPGDVAWERAEVETASVVMPSKARRLVVIAAYLALSFVLMGIAAAATVSEACITNDVCTRRDDRAFATIGLVWLSLVALAVVLGWSGRLWGARSTAAAQDLSTPPTPP